MRCGHADDLDQLAHERAGEQEEADRGDGADAALESRGTSARGRRRAARRATTSTAAWTRRVPSVLRCVGGGVRSRAARLADYGSAAAGAGVGGAPLRSAISPARARATRAATRARRTRRRRVTAAAVASTCRRRRRESAARTRARCSSRARPAESRPRPRRAPARRAPARDRPRMPSPTSQLGGDARRERRADEPRQVRAPR